ncbi:hypothetical protein DRE_03389 [Drechslerella stenobrocha 248]|uniref:BTB domain-containing protein n=1 Tax=Drechslerella stenobrocha 248 TaxID=1043628 RepID=W7IE31_9PEZI|nr:hypothetical protein DRE_03389 [Drechslerella stenobrocha 248]
MSSQWTPSLHIVSLLNSEPIVIKIGKENERILVHRSLFTASESPSLKAVVSGKYKEGKGENGLDWTSEDPDAVKRMIAFLYTGDYNVTEPKDVSIGLAPFVERTNVDDTDAQKTISEYNFNDGSTKRDEVARALTPIQHHLKDIHLPTWRVNTEAGNLEYADRSGRIFEYGPLFLAHAKVFVLADYHQAELLMAAALRRLSQVMIHAAESSANLTSDLIQLVNYTYRQEVLRPENLRKLVAQFAALHFQELNGGEWEEVLEQGGLFVKEVNSARAPAVLENVVQDIAGLTVVSASPLTSSSTAMDDLGYW